MDFEKLISLQIIFYNSKVLNIDFIFGLINKTYIIEHLNNGKSLNLFYNS